MKKKVYSEEQFNTSRWTGGTTTEFAIYPENSRYIDRNFIWRISSAKVETEESTFTRLPDYDRILMVLDGEVVLAHGQERSVSLKTFEQDSFSGDAGTKSFGKITDYNLMYSKGNFGRMELMTAESEAHTVRLTDDNRFAYRSCGFYCVSGYGIVSVGGETHMVKSGQQFIADFDKDQEAAVVLMGEGKLIFTEICYNSEEIPEEEIAEESAAMEDFAAAFKIVHGRYKWSEVLGKNKEMWYDQALSSKLQKLERTYITLLIWIIVTLIILAAGLKFMSDAAVVAAVLGWTLLHTLLLSPLIYMAVLPKPISAHIRRVDQLSRHERDMYEKEQEENQQAGKVLKKYKNSGRKDRMGTDE